MNKCERCSAALADNITFCPLCGGYITRDSSEFSKTEYAKTRFYTTKKKVMGILNRILLISFIVVSSIALIQILFFTVDFKNWWYIYAAASFIIAKLAVLDMIKRYSYTWRHTVGSCLYLSVFIIFIDWYSTGFNGFSFSFVLPGMLAAGAVLISVFTFTRIINPLACLQVSMSVFIFGVLLTAFDVVMYYTKVLDVIFLPALISCIAIVISFLITLLFLKKDFKIIFVSDKPV